MIKAEVIFAALTFVAMFSCYLCENKIIDVKGPKLNRLNQFARNPMIQTDIKLVGLDSMNNVQTHEFNGNNVMIDTNKIASQAALANSARDVEEDVDDPFITTASGKPRPVFERGLEADQWAEDVIPGLNDGQQSQRPLSRVKRCGGGDDDDGDANRARRRARRARRVAKRRAAKVNKAKKTKTTKTTVTKKVIKNGEVISEETTNTGPATKVVSASQQPAATVATTNVVQNVQAQPGAAVNAATSVSSPAVNVQSSVQVGSSK